MNGKKFAYHKIIHYLCGNKLLTSLMARKRNNSGALRNEQRDIHDRVISFYNTQPRGGNAGTARAHDHRLLTAAHAAAPSLFQCHTPLLEQQLLRPSAASERRAPQAPAEWT